MTPGAIAGFESVNGGAVCSDGTGRGSGIPATLAIGLVVWIAYNISGLRPPWSPIIVSDGDSGSSLRQAVFGCTAALAAFHLFRRRSIGAALVQFLPLVLLGVGLCATVVVSAEPTLTMKRSTVFFGGLMALIAAVHFSPTPVRTMQRLILVITSAAAWISLMGMALLPNAMYSLAERPGLAGVAPHPNTLAPAMVVGFIISLGMVPSGNRQRVLCWLGRLGLLVALVLTDSVTSFVLLAAGLTTFLILTSSFYRRGVIQICAVALTIVVLYVGPANIRSGMFAAVDRNPTLSGRDVLWEQMILVGMERPFFGQGFRAFWYEGRGRELVGTWNPREAHHAYLDLFVDLGAIGLAAVLIVFAGGFWIGWCRWQGVAGTPQRLAVASMTAVAVSLMGVYAFGESLFLKIDNFSMFVLLWSLLLLMNRSWNAINREFDSSIALGQTVSAGPLPGDAGARLVRGTCEP